MKMKLSVLAITFLFFQFLVAQPVNIIPKPQSVVPHTGTFTLDASTLIVTEGSELEKESGFLQAYIRQLYGINLSIGKTNTHASNAIVLNYERMDNAVAGAYRMEVKDKEVYIAGDNAAGVFYGIQSLMQLLPVEKKQPVTIPQLSIEDAPRFAHRGMHLDVCRHFMPVDFVKKYIDFIAQYKMNVFHWHLTDDQGWRIEIKKYPKLTEVGAWRDGTIIGRHPGTGNDNKKTGGFYTQDEIKQIVQYATDRHITVLPEIELPGHASAAIAAYPFLSCFPSEPTKITGTASKMSAKRQADGQPKVVQETWGVFEDVFCPSEETFKFLEDVMDEVVTLFPSTYIHVGGDECPKEAWKRSPFCQQLIKEKGLKDEHGLQSYFIQRMEKYLNNKGRKIIGWDEILEGGLAPNASVMSWRGEEGGIAAAKQGHDVVMTPGEFCYLDHSQSKNEDSVTIGGYVSLEKVYSYNPVPAALSAAEAKHILGAQGNVWTEYMKTPGKVEYMIFPRMAALSEVLWTNPENKNWEDFEKRLPGLFKRLDSSKTNYSKAFYQLKASISPTPQWDGLLWNLESKLGNARIVYAFEDTVIDNESARVLYKDAGVYMQPVRIKSSVKAMAYLSTDVIELQKPVEQEFHFNKATGKKITLANPPSRNYPGNGVFTLVDGVQNDKGMNRSGDFIGFEGGDADATIDLGKMESIQQVSVHSFTAQGSWIYAPGEITVFTSADGKDYKPVGNIKIEEIKAGNNLYRIKMPAGTSAQHLRVLIKNKGILPSGLPGAGHAAWLFADEIEVE